MAYLAATRIWDGTNTVIVNPDGSLSAAVTGSVAVSSGTINQITNPVSVTGSVSVSGTINQITNPVSVTGPLTDAQLRANAVVTIVSDGTHTVNVHPIDTQIHGDEYGMVTNAIIHGRTTSGGGGFVDVKVSPSGAIQVGGDVAVSGSVAVSSGTITQITNPISVVGSITVGTISHIVDPVTVNGSVAISSGTINQITNPVDVTGSVAVSSVGSGTITQIVNPVTVSGAVSVSGTVNVGTVTQIANPVAVTGSVAVSNGTIDQITNPVSVIGTVSVGTITQIVNPVTVSGSVAVSSIGSGTVTQIVNPVTVGGTVGVSSGTITQIVNPVAVTGSVAVNSIGSGTVTQIVNPVSVTGSVGVSGSVAVSSGTITQIANPVVVSGSVSVGTITQIVNPVSVTGALTSVASITSPVAVSSVGSGTITRITDPVSIVEPITSVFSVANLSAFGDFVTAENTPSMQLDFIYGVNTQLGTLAATNSATSDTNAGRLRLQSGTNSAGNATFISVRPVKYRAGQGVTARFTTAFSTSAASNTQIVGMGNAVDGYFVGFSGTSFGVLHRVGGVDFWTPQASWNGEALDFTLVPANGNVWMVRYPFLGYGAIHFFVLHPTGVWKRVHTIQYPNSTPAIQLSNPNLSFYAQSINAGSTTNCITYVGSVGIFLNGSRDFLGPRYGTNRLASVNGTAAVMNLKNATTYNGVTNRSLVRIRSISVVSDGGNTTCQLNVIKGATITAPTFTAINGTTADGGTTITNGNSVTSVDIAGTATTGGIIQFNTALARNSSVWCDVSAYDLYIEPGTTLTFQAITGASTGVVVSVNWIEDI